MSSNAEKIRSVYEQMGSTSTLDPIMSSTDYADTFKCVTYPPSAGIPEMDSKAYKEYFERYTKISTSRKMVLEELIDAGNKVIAHGTTMMTFHDGSEVVTAHMNILTFDEEGKLAHIKQFIDSHNVVQMREKFKPQA
ncbi:hypothetical protein DL96DRAFT_1715133 [Flagelloscypha sp. PMI_526]|nr:hypothetical protein DL96DRAFT_1715133 [Flagelloscypha sp. PMI_526]